MSISNSLIEKFRYWKGKLMPIGTRRRAVYQWFLNIAKRILGVSEQTPLFEQLISKYRRLRDAILPIGSRRRSVYDWFTGLLKHRKEEYTPLSSTGQKIFGINFFGCLTQTFGYAESAKAFAEAVKSTGIPYSINNIVVDGHPENTDKTYKNIIDNKFPYCFNIIHDLNVGSLPKIFQSKGEDYFKRYNIAIWYWELEKLPEHFSEWFKFLDEIWVTSDFVYNAVSKVAPIPVLKITYPLAPINKDELIDSGEIRRNLKIPEDAFVFLSVFDFQSTAERKNYSGVIDAFTKTFPGRDENVVLVLKSINSYFYHEQAAQLKSKIKNNRNIVWIDKFISKKEILSLEKSSDSYISLHRSEGLGLDLARMMQLGKPVIATAYGGNMEFMNSENSFWVKYDLKELEDTYGPYEKGAFWAEPDINSAAKAMRDIYTNKEIGDEIGRKASESIRKGIDVSITAVQIADRTREIYNRWPEQQCLKLIAGQETERGSLTNISEIMMKIEEVIAAKNNMIIHSSATDYKQTLADKKVVEPAGIVNINDLMRFDGDEFIEETYRNILSREPDPAGFMHHRNLFLESASKEVVLYSIGTSLEAQIKKVKIEGLVDIRKKIKKYLVAKWLKMNLPLLSMPLFWVYRLVKLPTHFQELSRYARELQSFNASISDLAQKDESLLQIITETKKELANKIDIPKREHLLDKLYIDFEDKFRGARNDIKERVKVYLPHIEKTRTGTKDMPIIDIGCGRGELLELLKENNFVAKGIDLNQVMISLCRGLNLDVIEGDAVEYLDNQPANSIGAITGIHFIEHLPYNDIIKLLDISYRVLKPGGLVIFETPNPQNIIVGAYTFHFDPYHKTPLVAGVLQFLVEQRGFTKTEIIRLHKYSDFAQSTDHDQFKDKWFYSEMDYAIIGHKI